MIKTIKAGTYEVKIVFTLDKDISETGLDSFFENALYNGIACISESDIGEYKQVQEEREEKEEKSESFQKCTWELAWKLAQENYEEEYGTGSWNDADKYAREDYVHAAYEEIMKKASDRR